MYLLRTPILALSKSAAVRRALVAAPVTRDVVKRFVAGGTSADAVAAVKALQGKGLAVTIDFLGEDTTTVDQARATVDAYLDLIAALDAAGAAKDAELSVKLSAVGQSLPATAVPEGGPAYATAAAREIAAAAYAVGGRVTLDMEDHSTTDLTLATLAELRKDFPDVGVAIQAMLLRTPKDLATLTGAGSRVRLVKGAYAEPDSVAFDDSGDIDAAYVRGLRTLMQGDGYPMVGSHDPRLIAIADKLAQENHRGKDTWEYQMLFGIRPDEQIRLAARGHKVRVYVPYGQDWYGYFTRRLAEKPANLRFFLRSFLTKK